MKQILIPIILFIAGVSIPPPGGVVQSEEKQSDSSVVITIAAVGDLMCHSVQYKYAQGLSGEYNFNPFFDYVREELSSADFTIGNLETVMAGSREGYSGYPFFNSPDEYLDALQYAGFDLLITANNHSLDKGEAGLRRTIQQLKERNINYNGTFTSESDRDSIRIFDIKGVKTAFLSYTYGTNGIPVPKSKPFLINLLDTLLIRRDIQNARAKNSDIVLVHFHFGDEYQREPNIYQKIIVKKTIEAGADIIIGGHPHVLQPVELFSTSVASVDTGVIAYSLGNFFSNQRWRYSDAGAILYITLSKNFEDGIIKISEVEYLPTWVYKSNREFKILPSSEFYDFLNTNEKNKMQQAFNDTKSVMSRYTDRIKIRNLTKQAAQ